MTPIADLLCGLAAVPLLLLLVTARPMRPEYFMGTHLVSGPIALVLAASWALHLVATPLPGILPNVVLGLLWPGFVIMMTGLPWSAYRNRKANGVKLACVAILLAPVALGHGAAWHPFVPWLGGALIALVGLSGTWVVVGQFVRRRVFKLLLMTGLVRRPPSQFDEGQRKVQRERWKALPVDAPVSELLGFARSLAPEVRKEALERLAARADLEAAVATALQRSDLWAAYLYVVQDYPRSRAPLAPTVVALLSERRKQWTDRLSADANAVPDTGEIMPFLECALAILRDGGAVSAELAAWKDLLAAHRKLAGLAKELARAIRKVG